MQDGQTQHGDLMFPTVEFTSDVAADLSPRDFERGLRFAHVMMSINQHEGREGVIFARALAEVLVNKGLVDKPELETMMAQVSHQLEALPTPKVKLARSEDKYGFGGAVIVDCASRVHLCRARCCTFDFYLTEQDLDEGIVRWDYGRPYWIQKQTDGYCLHCELGSLRCRIHANRPYVCRAYDCRDDTRVWLDFERMIPAPQSQPDGDNGRCAPRAIQGQTADG
jgi:Fe-S-cluster containining protein